MTRRKRNWLLVIAVAALAGLGGLSIAGYLLSKRFEPFIREQAIAYLQKRFDSEVELAALRVDMPGLSSLGYFFTRGRGAFAHVTGEGVVLRHKGRRDVPPMFSMKEFSFDVDLASVLSPTKKVELVVVHTMEINIPPKGERPQLGGDSSNNASTDSDGVLIEHVEITDCILRTLPKDPKKRPLRFDIHRVYLASAGNDVVMKYIAELTNAKPPGEIVSRGTFGPWNADEPGDSPLAGSYTFDNADLGVFRGIAGILDSTGEFQGTLSEISVHGQASVPQFRLKRSDNAVSLKTKFEVTVDGTNGDTILKPVTGTLGSTAFTTSGAIIKEEESDRHKSITLDATITNGDLRDVMKLAMKGPPFMEGVLALKTKIEIPPLSGSVREKIRLEGHFELTNGKFLKAKIQDQIDSLSRRAQGQPGNEAIDEVVTAMGGTFLLDDEVITFSSLSFTVPGTGVDLKGNFDLDKDVLDFHGTLRLDAKISETMTGWKRWVLKPINPFFSKDGAGTLLHIQVTGTRDQPKFGLDKGSQADTGKQNKKGR